MNDPQKVIEVEKSSLFSLKNEVLRKQDELRKKNENSGNIKKVLNNHKRKETIEINKIEKEGKIAKDYEIDDSKEFENSRRMLEAKSKYYERMIQENCSEKDSSSLVLFNKKYENKNKKELVEFIDCFGRTRRVQKDELKKLEKDNDNLADVLESRLASEDTKRSQKKSVQCNEPSDQEFFKRQKEEWQKNEEINKNRNEIHYSNVLFNEARSHGVSYFAFSQDSQERKEQQKKLLELRKSTEEAQKKRLILKQNRDQIMCNRVLSAKKRKMIKLGSSFEIAHEVEKNDEQRSHDDEIKNNMEKDPEEELGKVMKRRSHIRQWDKNKMVHPSKNNYKCDESNIDWRPQKEHELMSQDQWINKQRSIRKQEFAPPQKLYEPQAYSKIYSSPDYKNMEESISIGLKFMKQKFGRKS